VAAAGDSPGVNGGEQGSRAERYPLSPKHKDLMAQVQAALHRGS
jgi:hypothetical protein